MSERQAAAEVRDASVGERRAIRFVLDGEVRSVAGIEPTLTVLTWLREHAQRTGTKEGCAEGDCGACTVVLAELDASDRLSWQPINACIRFLPTLDGKALFTVESLKAPDGRLHPAQRAMVDCHGSQCGFCTPGFVMSLFALHRTEPAPSRERIDDALSGNLCRCTGYRPIVEAAQAMHRHDDDPAPGFWLHAPAAHESGAEGEARLAEQLRAIRPSGTLALAGERGSYFAPVDVDALAGLLRRHPDARILAGGTDVGLWVTKQHRNLGTVVHVGQVAELHLVEKSATHLAIGAAVSLERAYSQICAHYPQLTELQRRFASPPIRCSGTLGGNLANGSPIGDSMPVLMVLGASIVLRRGERRRELPLEDYYLAYQRTALAPGEFLERVRIPLPVRGRRVATYKISKRFDQDISAVCGAYCLELDGERIGRARVAYGGMAATPKRAARCEQALAGRAWNEATLRSAMAALDEDFTPIGDMRASAGYRRTVARNLLRRFFIETTAPAVPTRVIEYAR